ncbi:MAG: PHP domain-containing protein [Gemmataceae bacterium]
MPTRQPFTYLCQQLARGPRAGRADLHLHTTASDGAYTPVEVVDLARRAGLAAIAITDHDTVAGAGPARAAAPVSLEVIAGVEITCEFRGRELHLLGYFVDPQSQPLMDALATIREGRAARFGAMVERLRQAGVPVEVGGLEAHSLGRRHLAELLVAQGRAGSVREAFQRWLRDGASCCVAKPRLAVGEAIRLVRQAGGVAAWAHPAYDGETRPALAELAALGLGGVEVEYPSTTRSQRAALRGWAAGLGLAVTGGSDCHGPGPRAVGAATVSDEELERLRGKACSAPCTTRSSKA